MFSEHDDTNDFRPRLDDAAQIWVCLQNRCWAHGNKKVRQILEAVDTIETVLPYYKLNLTAGVSWYDLEPDKSPITN